jgi:hypothetical protein
LQKSIRNIAQSFREFFVQIDGRQIVGKKCHLWKKLEKRGGAVARATAKRKDLCRRRGQTSRLNILTATLIAIWV